MPKNEHKRQQKLAKKQRRTNEIKKLRNKSNNQSTRDLVLLAQQTPWLGCYMSESQGMHSVFAIRQARTGPMASIFLVDSDCLGIKDAFFIKEFDIEAFRERRLTTEKVTPEHALKLILGATAFARSAGFEPHPLSDVCKLIFGNTDISECDKEFVFGRDGKPCYINGPHDSPEKQRQIIMTLSELGPGNYTFIKVSGRQSFGEVDMLGSEYDDSDDDGDEYEDENEAHDEPSESDFDSMTIDAVEVQHK